MAKQRVGFFFGDTLCGILFKFRGILGNIAAVTHRILGIVIDRLRDKSFMLLEQRDQIFTGLHFR